MTMRHSSSITTKYTRALFILGKNVGSCIIHAFVYVVMLLCRNSESAFFGDAALLRHFFIGEDIAMPDYEKLYHLMLNASEDALAALEAGNFDWARLTLLEAEQKAEELYVEDR